MSEKKKVDYRAWANRHLKDASTQLPPVYSTGYNTPKYVSPSSKPKKKEKLYRVEFECTCGNSDIYVGGTQTTINRIRKKNIPACVRCTNFMKMRGIKENIFIALYIYIRCLLQILKRK